MSKGTLYHDFFHNPDARGEYSGCNISFRGDKFYSYSTVIGQKFYKGKTSYLILSSESMSSTTARHISGLRNACPYGYDNIIYAPFRRGEYYGYTLNSIGELFERDITMKLDNAKNLNQKPYMDEAIRLISNYDKFRTTFRVKCFKGEAKLTKIIEGIEAERSKPVDPVKAEKRREVRARQLAKKLETVKDWTYLDKVKFCFNLQSGDGFDVKTRNELRKSIIESLSLNLGDRNRTSFIWIKGDNIITSQHVRIPVAIVKRAINTWRRYGIGEVHQVGVYTLDEANEKYMKIGCHYIPMENILAVEKRLNEQEA